MMKFDTVTDEQVQYIIDNYQMMTNKKIAVNLNIPYTRVVYVANKLNLIKQPHKSWTEEENKFIVDNYLTMTSEEIAKILKRTVHSINARKDDLHLTKLEKWSEEEVKFLVDNYMILTHAEIGEKLGRSDSSVRAKCFEMDLYKKELPWSEDEIAFVREHYMEYTNAEISELLGRSLDAIHLKASKLGMKKSPYHCNYHYFDNIDDEYKAYWLGFMTADGWISKNNETNSAAVGVELQYGDISHLKKFNKCLDGNYKITDRWRTCNLSRYKDKKNHECVFRVYSLKMYDSLEALGFTNNKSFDATVPSLRLDLYRHWIRGYFDGNGCISNKKQLRVSFTTASKELAYSLKNIVSNYNIELHVYNTVNEYGTTIYNVTATSKNNKLGLLNFMYEDSHIYLSRKYNEYLKVLYNDAMNCPAN